MSIRKKYLVTAGPTREALDPVRFLTNHSTGKMGYAIAAELARRGADVVLVSGPTALETPQGVRRVNVVSADEMYQACVELWPAMDGTVMCAAVADYTPVDVSPTKIKKISVGSQDAEWSGEPTNSRSAGNITLELRPTRDIAAELGRTKRAGQTLVGFALETDNEEANAVDKMRRKNLDFIVLNSLRDQGAGFGGDTNRITIFERQPDTSTDTFLATRTCYPLETKTAAATHIADLLQI